MANDEISEEFNSCPFKELDCESDDLFLNLREYLVQEIQKDDLSDLNYIVEKAKDILGKSNCIYSPEAQPILQALETVYSDSQALLSNILMLLDSELGQRKQATEPIWCELNELIQVPRLIKNENEAIHTDAKDLDEIIIWGVTESSVSEGNLTNLQSSFYQGHHRVSDKVQLISGKLIYKNNSLDDFSTVELLQSVSRFPLTEICLSGNRIGPLTGAWIFSNLNVNCIDLSRNKLGYRGSRLAQLSVSPALNHMLIAPNCLLTHLNLSYNNLDDENAKHLSNGLASNTSLISLDVRGNLMGVRSCTYFAMAFSENRTLKEFYAGYNCFERRGATILLQEVSQSNTLVSLDLSWCSTRQKSTKDQVGNKAHYDKLLCDFIGNGINLCWLDISHSSIDSSLGHELTKCIAQNHTIESLNISNNPIGNDVFREFIDLIMNSQGMKYLDLRSTINISDTYLIEITRALECSKKIVLLPRSAKY